MAETTGISWTDSTFNHVRGCSKISPGCENCYAATMSKRNPGTLGVWGPNGTRVVASESMWQQPLKWNKRAGGDRQRWERAAAECRSEYDGIEPYQRPRVFCASLADVFEDWQGRIRTTEKLEGGGNAVAWYRPDIGVCRAGQTTPGLQMGERLATMDDVRRQLFRLIDATPNLDWLILTKRPENIAKMMPKRFVKDRQPIFPGCPGPLGEPIDCMIEGGIRKNLWLGTTVENQDYAKNRITELVKNPAAIHFVSYEPALGPLKLPFRYGDDPYHSDYGQSLIRQKIDWVICGCESGHHRRPMKIEWAESVRDQCKAAGVAFFMKQMEINGKVETDIEKFPASLQVREFPEASSA